MFFKAILDFVERFDIYIYIILLCRPMLEVHIFWYLFLIYLTICNYRLIFQTKNVKNNFLEKTLYFGVKSWVITTILLHQPYNIILVPLQICFTVVINSLNSEVNISKMGEVQVFAHIWIGNTFYFYQGNSNSLATIDVAAGYIGFQSHLPFLNGTLMLINTYSAPVLSFLLLIYLLAKQSHRKHKEILQLSKTYVAWRLLPLTIYTIIISIHRHHLFIWTVFSPKLLYEAVHSAVICVATLFVVVITMIYNSISKER